MSESLTRWRLPESARVPLRPVTKNELAYLQIREKILEGDLPPEMSLDREALARPLGLSTTPVREALRRLESERLVYTRAHRDTVVASASPEDLENVYRVRLHLDPLAAALAAKNASSEVRAKLKKTLEIDPHMTATEELDFNRTLHREIYS